MSVDRTTLEALRVHRKEQIGERLFLGPAWEEHDYLFTTTVGSPLHPDDVSKVPPSSSRTSMCPGLAGHGS